MAFGLKAFGNFLDDVTGKTAADAAVSAAQIQSDAATAAAAQTADATALQRQDLQPFTQFGSSFIDPAQQAVAQSQQLFSDPGSIMNNPFFTALQDQARTNILQNSAVRGRLDTGGTQQHLQDSALRTGFDVLNQERQAQLQNVGVLQGLVNQGQAAATGQAGFTGFGNQVQTGQLTDAAAATAGGIIGQANAQSAGAQGLLGAGIGAATGGFGLPSFGNFSNPFGGTNATPVPTNFSNTGRPVGGF